MFVWEYSPTLNICDALCSMNLESTTNNIPHIMPKLDVKYLSYKEIHLNTQLTVNNYNQIL